MAALDVYRPTRRCKSEDQTTGTIFVIRVILNYFTGRDGLAEFLDADAANDALVNGVLGKLESTRCDFFADNLDELHTSNSSQVQNGRQGQIRELISRINGWWACRTGGPRSTSAHPTDYQ